MLGHVAIATVFELLATTLLVASFSRPVGAKAKAMPSHGAVYVAALIYFLIGAALFCIGLLKRSVTEMAVTNKRVIVKTGLAERRTTDILLSRIESVVVDEPAMARILCYGTVIVHGTGGTPEIFGTIQHPLKCPEQLQRQIAAEPKSS